MFELDPGAHVEVRRGSEPVLLARLQGAGGAGAEIVSPFTDRLVAKFGLPVAGWRGRGGRRRMPDGGMSDGHAPMAAQAGTEVASQRDEEPGGDA